MAKPTIEDLLNQYVQNLQNSPNCKREDLYRYADFYELKCLANSDGIYSSTDFENDLRPLSDDLGQGDTEANNEEKLLEKSKKGDKWETLAKESLKIILLREKTFAGFYPFIYNANGHSISIKENINDNDKLYIFLLLCANLQYSGMFTNQLTGSFEFVSRYVLKRFLPKKAKVKLFASSNTESKEKWVIDISKFWDKLQYLEKFLKGSIRISEDQLSKYDKGDGGLDIVAMVSPGDNAAHFPIAFAQCACSPTEWLGKQHSISPSEWNPILALTTLPQRYMFIPQNYRDAQDSWFSSHKIKETILMDRQRIILNFKKLSKFKDYNSYSIVEKIINKKESVF